MTKGEAINKIKGYLTDYLPIEDYEEAEEIVKALEQEPCEDTISRQAAIEAIEHRLAEPAYQHTGEDWYVGMNCAESELYELPSAQPEIIRCKDCKFYSPMNRETKTGICNLIMHQNFGDNWFCAGAERRTDG